MAISWNKLENEITDWLEDLGEKTTDDTAKFFADSYGKCVADGIDPLGNGILVPPGKEALIEKAWKGGYALQSASSVKLGPATWLPVEAAILLFWTAVVFDFKIPFPGTVTGVSNLTTAPGSPGIAVAIDKAFKQEEAPKVAKELVNGYKKHIATVNGLFTGITPPLASAPLPVPWVGIK